MLRRSLASVLATVLVVSPQIASAAESGEFHCWRADEAKAMRLLRLQTMLMVDAIKCRDTIPATLDSYNAFMGKRRELIVNHKYALQARFVRLHGPVEGIAKATNYDTLMGNQVSSTGIDVKRCETSGLYARMAASAPEDDLHAMAGVLAPDETLVECPAAAPAPARPAGMVIPVWRRPAPGAAPAADPALTATGAPVRAKVAPAAPASSLDDERRETLKALQAAVLALTKATAAMTPAAAPVVDEGN